MSRSALIAVLSAAGLLVTACGATNGRFATMTNGVTFRLELWQEPHGGALYYRRVYVGPSRACFHGNEPWCPGRAGALTGAAVDGRTLFRASGHGVVATRFASANRLWNQLGRDGINRPRVLAALAKGSPSSWPRWARALHRDIEPARRLASGFGDGVDVLIAATPRPVLWLGRRVLGRKLVLAALYEDYFEFDYYDYAHTAAGQLVLRGWPETSPVGQRLLRYFRRYPAIRAGGVTAYGRHDLVAAFGKSIIRISLRSEQKLSPSEHWVVLSALAQVNA